MSYRTLTNSRAVRMAAKEKPPRQERPPKKKQAGYNALYGACHDLLAMDGIAQNRGTLTLPLWAREMLEAAIKKAEGNQ